MMGGYFLFYLFIFIVIKIIFVFGGFAYETTQTGKLKLNHLGDNFTAQKTVEENFGEELNLFEKSILA